MSTKNKSETLPAPTAFDRLVGSHDQPGLYSASSISTVQVNIGLRCNLSCRHCHVNSSPHRKEEMSWETMERVLALAHELGAETIDITGGAPEMHPHFRKFVNAASDAGHAVIVRTNLTILLESGYEDLPSFFRDKGVALVASLPCYLEENVDAQRGDGVYQESVEAIRILNECGYGVDPAYDLTLIYNPVGPQLPPAQVTLEEEYRRELQERFGIRFTSLHTITNVPIGRFRGDLRRAKALEEYECLLKESYNADTVEHLMCRHQISVGWDGTLYDCDFNYGCELPVIAEQKNVHHASADSIRDRRIVTGTHCFACTAGAGSSCGGALAVEGSG